MQGTQALVLLFSRFLTQYMVPGQALVGRMGREEGLGCPPLSTQSAGNLELTSNRRHMALQLPCRPRLDLFQKGGVEGIHMLVHTV